VDVEATLSEIVGAENFMYDHTLPQTYPNDFSYLPVGTPDYVLRPSSAEEVSAIVRPCDENKIPMEPFSSKIHFYEAAIPKGGGPVLDMSRMGKILEIDPDNRRVRFEAGVT
jgi:glycolate oxidase